MDKTTITGTVSLAGPYITWKNFYDHKTSGSVAIYVPAPIGGTGASHIDIEHNDVTGGAYGVQTAIESASGYPVVTNITINGNRIYNYGQSAGQEDGLRVDDFNTVTVSNNDIYGTHESGAHRDNLQVNGGRHKLHLHPQLLPRQRSQHDVYLPGSLDGDLLGHR